MKADIVEVEPGVYSVIEGLASWEVRVVGSEVTIAGHRFVPVRRTADSRASIIAAMPGKIVRVLVAVGDEVVAGQGIMVIEAMKMQNELKASRGGRVTAIEARENDSVKAGAVLATIE